MLLQNKNKRPDYALGDSQADIEKQKIQAALKNLGYPEFSKMSGWGGDEDAKAQAMNMIYEAVKYNAEAGDRISGWLEGGKVTPSVALRVKREYFDENYTAQNPGTVDNMQPPSGPTVVQPTQTAGTKKGIFNNVNLDTLKNVMNSISQPASGQKNTAVTTTAPAQAAAPGLSLRNPMVQVGLVVSVLAVGAAVISTRKKK